MTPVSISKFIPAVLELCLFERSEEKFDHVIKYQFSNEGDMVFEYAISPIAASLLVS